MNKDFHRNSHFDIGRSKIMDKGIFKGERCAFCGKQAENFLFAAFVCDSDACIEKARAVRGGPGGHRLKKLEKNE